MDSNQDTAASLCAATADTQGPSPAHGTGRTASARLRCWAGTLAWAAALLAGSPAGAQENDATRAAAFMPASQVWARVLPPPTQREQRVRAALQRAVPAPRVAALVQELLSADVQVAVVHDPPDGLGAYYPNLALAGYEHVYANERERRIVGGSWGLIVLDARLEEQAEREIIAFVLAHEYGHHRLARGHTEVQADAFARRMLSPSGLWSPRAAQSAFELAVRLPFARQLVSGVDERLRALEEEPREAATAGLRR